MRSTSVARALSAASLALLLPSSLLAASGNVDLPRFPAISPDGSEVVFSWRGDLWKATLPKRNGGNAQGTLQAVRLTSHPMNEHRSTWSPDGQSIAFESDRDGYTNVFLMNPDGTNIRQVTQSDRSFGITDFSHDGTRVLGHASREGDVYRGLRPYNVSIHGGEITRVHDAFGSMPAVSPDGKHIAFERGGSDWDRRHYRGPDARDVWVYSDPEHGGNGEFTQITEWTGNDGQPAWADADTILFLSDRELDTVNLYTIDLGQPDARAKRLTSFDGIDVQSFSVSEDGSDVVLHVWDTLYSLNLSRTNATPVALRITAPEDELTNYEIKQIGREVSEARLSPDGQVMAYIAYGEVFVRNVDDDSPTRRITNNHARETDIAWSPDGNRLYFVSDADGTQSIYAATVTLTRSELREALKQTLGDEGIEGVGAGPDEPEADEPAADDGPSGPLAGDWSGQATGVAQMTGGEDVIPMTLRFTRSDGQITVTIDTLGGSFTSSVAEFDATTGSIRAEFTIEGGPTILTGTVEGDSMSGSWDAPGAGMSGSWTASRQAVAQAAEAPETEDSEKPAESDETTEETPPHLDPSRWHDAMRFEISAVLQSEHNDARVMPTPDGTRLTFTRDMSDVMIHDLVTGEERVLIETWDMRSEWRMSPCGRYVAYAINDMDFNTDVHVVPVEGSFEPVNITMHPDNDYMPRWSHDGKILSFVSGRNDNQNDVFRVYLDPDLTALRGKDLEAYYEAASDAAKKIKPVDAIDFEALRAKHEAGEYERAEAEGDEPFTHEDLKTAYLRLDRMTWLDGSEWNLEMTPAADHFVFSGVVDGSSGIWSVDWKGQDRKRLTGSGSVQQLSHDGKKIVLVSGGQARSVNASGGGDSTHPISHEMRIDLAEQSKWKFKDAARTLGMSFYHEDMKGLDWDALTERYADLATKARTADEFAHVASRLLGELNGSHLGVYPSDRVSSDVRVSNGRLGIDYSHLGDAIRVDRVLHQSPVSTGTMALHEGDHIVMVDFVDVDPLTSYEELLRGRIGEETVITVHRPLESFADDRREALADRVEDGMVELNLLVTPISYGQESGLRYNQWQLDRRALVEELSDGRIGYLHIRGMNMSSLEEFERDLFAAAYGKDGLIVDVRNNGGGSTADLVLSSIMVQPHAYTVARNADPSYTDGYPRDRLFIQRYTKPMTMMCNEKSFSNAEIVSHAFKTLGRGTLVGQQTYGGVISTGAFTLVDGTRVRQPFRGWYLLDGTDMENNGAMPDVVIEQTPEAESAEADEQIEAAVREMLGRL
ncbi:MAG: S41 family peptidase [bacterium]|nr:S41 family peptidase [bacterium]